MYRLKTIAACFGVGAVVFASLYFATDTPPPCASVAIGGQVLSREGGTTSSSVFPVNAYCQENQP